MVHVGGESGGNVDGGEGNGGSHGVGGVGGGGAMGMGAVVYGGVSGRGGLGPGEGSAREENIDLQPHKFSTAQYNAYTPSKRIHN